jgi:hypothetical protein
MAIPDKQTWHRLTATGMLHRMMDSEETDSPMAIFCEEIVNKINREREEGKAVFRQNFDLYRTIDRQRDMAFGAAAALIEAFSHEYKLAATILKCKRNPSTRDIRLMIREGVMQKKPRTRKEIRDALENQAAGNGHADSGGGQG